MGLREVAPLMSSNYTLRQMDRGTRHFGVAFSTARIIVAAAILGCFALRANLRSFLSNSGLPSPFGRHAEAGQRPSRYQVAEESLGPAGPAESARSHNSNTAALLAGLQSYPFACMKSHGPTASREIHIDLTWNGGEWRRSLRFV